MLITFPPTSLLILQWQASPLGNVRSDAAHPVISTLHRLRTSEIQMPKSVSSAVTHRWHHLPALPFRDWHPFTKPYWFWQRKLAQRLYLVVTPFVPDHEVWYLNLKVSPTECNGKKWKIDSCGVWSAIFHSWAVVRVLGLPISCAGISNNMVPRGTKGV